MEETTAVLAYEDIDAEVVVRLSPVPMRDYFAIRGLHQSARTAAEITAVMQAFADAGVLLSWTFPEPCGFDGLMARDTSLALAIVRDWLAGVRDVPLPLPRAASGGTPSTPEASQPSSNEPSGSNT